MTNDVLTRLGGALAVAAGLILALAAYLQSLEPLGCIADVCDEQVMRDTPTSVTLLFDGGGVLLVASVLGIGVLLLALVNEQTSRVLFAIPFCLAWALAGALLLRRAAHHAPQLPA